jgi:hypothetical protein
VHEVVSGNGAPKCELLTKKEETFTLPGCSTWVLANAGATGYYRVGYQPDAVRALAKDAESKLDSGRAHRVANGHLGVGAGGTRAGRRLSWLWLRVGTLTAIARCWKTFSASSITSASIWQRIMTAIRIDLGCGSI